MPGNDELRRRLRGASFGYSNVSPGFQTAGDGEDPRQEYAEDRDDHGNPDFVRLQPLALPIEKSGKGKAPHGGDLRIELAAQVGADVIVPEYIAYQAAK